MNQIFEKLKEILDSFFGIFSDDIGIDLGTANTLVYVDGKGVTLNEPSIVAINRKTNQVVSLGARAKEMMGRTPSHIEVVQPLIDGEVSNFEVTEEMLSYLINQAQGGRMKLFGPRVVVGVPSHITNVQIRAVRDAARNAGAREVHIVEEPMAAAIGMKLPVMEPTGSMVIDIGGGTTDIAIIALGGVVIARNLKVAGDKLNSDLASYIRSEFKILIGKKSAEDLKIAVSQLSEDGNDTAEAPVRGRDLVTGLPREVVITNSDVREAIGGSVDRIIDTAKEVLETAPPEIVSDVMKRGVYLAGGGALIRGLPELLKEELKIPIYVSHDPLRAVVRGTGMILENIELYRDSLIPHDDELSPTE